MTSLDKVKIKKKRKKSFLSPSVAPKSIETPKTKSKRNSYNPGINSNIGPILQQTHSIKEDNLKTISNDGGHSFFTKSVSSNKSQFSVTSSEVSLEKSKKVLPSNFADIKSSLPATESQKIDIFDKFIMKKNQTKMFDEHEKKRAEDKLKGLYTNISQTPLRCK